MLAAVFALWRTFGSASWLAKRTESQAIEASRQASEAKKAGEEAVALGAPIPVTAPSVPVPNPGVPANIHTLEEFKELGGDKIPVELTRIVSTDGAHKRITVMKGQVSVVVGGFSQSQGDISQVLFFVVKKTAYFVDPRRIMKVTQTDKKGSQVTLYKLVFDILYSEPLKADGSVEWSNDLEMLLADSGLDQYVSIAAFEGGFHFTPTIKKAMLIVGLLGIFFGIAINGAVHVIPATFIHWVP